LTLFFIITWIVVITFIFLPKSLSFLENSFVFFVISIIIQNNFTIVGLNLDWIEGSDTYHLFFCYVLFRTVIYPVALVAIVNVLFSNALRFQQKVVATSVISATIFLTGFLGEKLHVYTYVQWNHWYSLLEIILFATITLLLAKLIKAIGKRKFSHGSL
jgi:hypothetical protein